jgi:hypothetical protein
MRFSVFLPMGKGAIMKTQRTKGSVKRMAEQEKKTQAYLQQYFRMQEPQLSLDELEIRPQDIVPMRRTTVFTNPWVFSRA